MADRPPVVLFVYARPDHARRTLEALAANDGASETDLIVYSDGSRGAGDAARVGSVRTLARRTTGFRSVRVVEREINLGLADNVIQGVGATMAEFGRAIVLEDDIVSARGFLDFMRAGLEVFERTPNVWHVSGWIYDFDTKGLPHYFLWPVMNCWGWASWADRWRHFERDPKRLLRKWNGKTRRSFNLDGTEDFLEQVELNAAGRLRSWAVFWYATIFEHGGLCLSPTRAYVQNVGLDGTGENCSRQVLPVFDRLRCFNGFVDGEPRENLEAVCRIKARLRPPFHRRMMRNARKTFRSL